MPTQTVNFTNQQLSHILETSGDDGFSARVRELVEKGMEAENDE